MATGALDANGVWIYGEDDSETTFSALLNKGMESVSSNLGMALIKVPTVTVTGTGASSTSAPNGSITVSSATSVTLNGFVNPSKFKSYKIIIDGNGTAATDVEGRIVDGGSVITNGYYGAGLVVAFNLALQTNYQVNNGASGYIGGLGVQNSQYEILLSDSDFASWTHRSFSTAQAAFYSGGYNHLISSALTGFYFRPASGRFTGNVSVYGVK